MKEFSELDISGFILNITRFGWFLACLLKYIYNKTYIIHLKVFRRHIHVCIRLILQKADQLLDFLIFIGLAVLSQTHRKNGFFQIIPTYHVTDFGKMRCSLVIN